MNETLMRRVQLIELKPISVKQSLYTQNLNSSRSQGVIGK